MNYRRSPMDLRGGSVDILEPYQPPRVLVKQSNVGDSLLDKGREANAEINAADGNHRRWVPKSLTSTSQGAQVDSKRTKLSKQIARLSSLDSTRSSSSMELEPDQSKQARLMPLISITSNDTATGDEGCEQQDTLGFNNGGASEHQQFGVYHYRDPFSHSNHPQGRPADVRRKNENKAKRRANVDADEDADEDDEDDDAFDDAPFHIYSGATSAARRQQQSERSAVSYPATLKQFEEMLDDRQGMNNSEQHFTKAEKANRPSLDGSIYSELFKGDGSKKLVGGKSGSQKRDKRRSKSPSSSSAGVKRRHSRRGFLGLASRLKLTKKHESIAKLQLSILNSGFISLKSLDRDLQSFLPRERLSVREFQDRVRLMRNYEVLSTIEYRFASKYETYVCKHAQQETNQPKNNYKKCIPYDYNRVVLKTLPSVSDSDYINASHVDSCLKPNAYIAAQGPNENTIDDFWRMIWEQRTFVVVMLTKVFDFIRVMCNQYWPVEVNKPERYGNIEVTLLYEEPLADFVIRTIKIAKLKGNTAATGTTQTDSNEQQSNNNNDQELAKSSSQDGSKTGDSSLRPRRGGEDERFQGSGESETEDDDEEYADDYDDEDGEDFETDYSEELVVNSTNQLDQVLAVRAPKYLVTKRPVRGRKHRNSTRSVTRLIITEPGAKSGRSASGLRELERPVLDEQFKNTSSLTQQTKSDLKTGLTAAAAGERPQPPNEFLHPLFNSLKLASSSTSIASEPNSPVTPRTPSSAGLDRSSATRKAVKKKRRERIRNQRPKRTQFMVPTESQLQDDDDETELVVDELNSPEDGEVPISRSASERIIYQFHYNSWASHTCPFIGSLLHFRRRVRICMDEMSKSGRTGPTVVHCNDGCGRTGTYLCIDANLELAEEDNVLDIYNYTRKMRQSRKFLIENLEQYKFVYDTIEEAIYCGKTWFPVSELHKRLKHKSQRNPINRKNEYLLEYEKICRMTSKFSIGDCAGGHRVENREKNRDVSTVPPDNFRPYLSSFQTNDSTDFVNAVFVDGYTRSKEYIVTEWPLHRTISDFWSLVYDHDCNSVILLANPGESSTYPSFLPSEKELRRRFGPVFSAEMVSYTHYQNIKSWIYTINKKIVSLTEVIAGVKSETKTTQVFQITCWPQGHRVPTSTNALVELMNMVERWRQRTTYGPVCVVSLNGKSRAGVYCAANVAIEQVVQHSEVDVFNAVKTVRRHRPQLIENMTEYKYCYDLILHYVLHYVNKPE